VGGIIGRLDFTAPRGRQRTITFWIAEMSVPWRGWVEIYDQNYDHERNLLEGNRKNLLEIMSNPIYAD